MFKHRSVLVAVALAAAVVLMTGNAAMSSGTGASASAAAAFAGTAGCGKSPTLSSGTHTIQSSGKNRSFILRIPANYNNNTPYRLIFGIHWLNGTMNDVDSGGSSGASWSYYGLERLHRVLGELVGAALVGEGDGTGPVEEGEAGRRHGRKYGGRPLGSACDGRACPSARRPAGHRRRRRDRGEGALRRRRDREPAPTSGPAEVDRAVKVGCGRPPPGRHPGMAARRDPRHRGPAARRAARGVRPHHRRRGGQADQDGAGRGRARASARSGSPRSRRARSTGEMVPMDASAAGEGKLGVHAARADRRRRRDQPVQLPAQPRRPQAGAGDRRRLPGRAEAGVSQTPLSAIALARAAARRVRPARRLAQRRHRRRRRRSATRIVDHDDIAHDHVHRLARGRLGHPRRGAAQEGRARARQQRAGDHRARRRLARPRPTKITVAGFSHAGQSCISTQRVYVHASIADDVRRRAGRRWSSALVVGDPLDEATDVSALITDRRARPRASWIDEAVAGGAEVAGRRQGRRRRRARADRAHRRARPT